MQDEYDRRGTFDATIHKTHVWLNDLLQALNWDDWYKAYIALRATLHALRDRLTVQETAHLGAQLPMLIRGFYYEGGTPSGKPSNMRHKDQFLAGLLGQVDALGALCRMGVLSIAGNVSFGDLRGPAALADPRLHARCEAHAGIKIAAATVDTTWPRVHVVMFPAQCKSFYRGEKRGVTMAKDVVCGMEVDEKEAARKSEYEGRSYYFCSRGCQQRFDAAPARYSDPRTTHRGATRQLTI